VATRQKIMMEEKKKEEKKKSGDAVKQLTSKKITQKLLEYDTIPLFGGASAFPWENFSTILAEHLDQKSLNVLCKNVEWLEEDRLLSHLGKEPFCLSYEVSPLDGLCYTVTDKENLLSLIPLLVFKDQKYVLPLEEDFIESFIVFISLQIMDAFNEVSYDPLLKPSLVEETTLPKENMLAIDLHCSLQEHSFLFKIFFPKLFQSEIVRYFSQKKGMKSTQQLKNTLKAEVGVRIGSVDLKKKQWDAVKVGDLLLLDHFSLNKGGKEAQLIVNGKALYQVSVQEDGLLIKNL
jgi:hypothetical protein